MPNIAFFQRMGVFALKNFLEAKSCDAIQSEMRLTQSLRPALITTSDGMDRVDESIRKTKLVKIDKQTKSSIEERLASIKSQIEAHYRRFPQLEIEQVVIYLRPTGSALVTQTEFITSKMNHRFRVIRLWEQPVEAFLTAPGLLPYAVLSQATNKEEVLTRVVAQIQQVGDRRQESNLTAATGILAGLQLSQTVIDRLIRSEIMRESVIYQQIY